ncbi:MAG: hypothetical protein QOD63_2427 [Actinomycetota bacterium]|nr:hypothetical protein [Actinomycetota bacterium]
MLGAGIVTMQNYTVRPSLRLFCVYCSFCATQRLYWPTSRQLVLADVLDCAMVTDDDLPEEILASYSKDGSLPTDRAEAPAPQAVEVTFILNMLAATSGLDPGTSSLRSYLPSHWAN